MHTSGVRSATKVIEIIAHSKRQDHARQARLWSLVIALCGYDSPSGAVQPLRRQEKESVTCDGSKYRTY
jgi:hypothetical protein